MNTKSLEKLFSRFFNNKILFNEIYHLASRYAVIPLIASLGISAALITLRELGTLQILELAAFDRLVRLQSEMATDPRLLIVEITEKDIQKYQEIPLSDALIAEILETLQKNNPKVIGLDIYRDIPHYPGHEALKQQLQADNVITIKELDPVDGVPSHPDVPEDRVGFNELVLDSDHVVRRNLMYAEFDGKSFYSFALRLSLKYLAPENLPFKTDSDSLYIGETQFKALNANSGNYQLKASEAAGWQILLKYRGAENIARRITIQDILEGNFDPNWIENKIILIGTTASSGKDLFLTPYQGEIGNNHLMSGVIIHAQMVSQIVGIVLDREQQFWFWQQWQEYLWIYAWSLLGAMFACRLNRVLLLGICEIFAIAFFSGFSFYLFTLGGWIPFVPPLLAFIGTTIIVVTYKSFYGNFHDSLTGLPNRELLTRKIQEIKDRKKDKNNFDIAIISLDIDRFKMINETLGYQAGDKFLVEIVKRLKSCLTHLDLIARLGNNEFAILLQSFHHVDEVKQIADRLKQTLTEPFSLNGQRIFTTVSIGIAFHNTKNSFLPEDLMRNAHTAMNFAKTSSISTNQIFVSQMHTQALSRLQLETDLRQAIKNQEFELYYQPIINLQTNKLSGFEALVRWNCPIRGFVSPGAFIPIAEQTGLIIPLGEWILREACDQMNQWHCQFPEMNSLIISVNLSAKQFVQPNLIEMIENIIQKTKINPKTLKLEITETIVMNDVKEATILLSQLKALNLCLSIDDFGTGYSSLSYLHDFPLDFLKVDRSFIKTINDSGEGSEIASTIITLGKKLGMEVIAEGIETEAQKNVITGLNCEYGQGFYFSKPLPKKDITFMLEKYQ